MSINLSGNTLIINTNAAANPGLATVGALLSVLNGNENVDQGLTTEEGSIAFGNKDTTQKYLKLRAIGLNNLRSEIVSICEYVPLTTDNHEDSAKIMFRHGENTQLRVTNVARLIELQRQIRVYLLTAAEKILENVYSDLYKTDFIEKLKTSVRDHATSITIDQAKDINTFTESYFDRLRRQPHDFSETVIANKNNPFLLGAIEYIVGDVLIKAVVEYISSVTTLSDNLKKNFGLFGALDVFSPQSSFSPSVSGISDAQNFLELYPDFKPTIDPGTLTGRVFTREHSHTDQLAQLLHSIGSALYHRDSSVTLSREMYAETSETASHSHNLSYLRGDLHNALQKIKNITVAGCTAYYPPGADRYLYNTLAGPRDTGLGAGKPASLNKLEGANLQDIFQNISYGHIHAELVAAMCFDTFSFWADGTPAQHTTPLSIADEVGYITVGSRYTERSKLLNQNADTFNTAGGMFGARTMGLRDAETGTGETVRYAPLEGTEKEDVSNTSVEGANSVYQTGIDHFIQGALVRNDFEEGPPSFSALVDFTEEYRENATKLYAEVMTRNPPESLVNTVNPGDSEQKNFAPVGNQTPASFFKTLLYDLKSDITDIRDTLYDDAPSLPALMLFLQTGYKTGHKSYGMRSADKQFVKGFNATWWTSVLQNGVYWGKTVGSNSQSAKSQDVDAGGATHSMLGHLINFYYEDITLAFFETVLDCPILQSAYDNKESFPGSSSNEPAYYGSPLSHNGDMVAKFTLWDSKLEEAGVQEIAGGGFQADGYLGCTAHSPDRTTTRPSYKHSNIDRTFDRSLGDKDVNRSLLRVTEGKGDDRYGFLRLMQRSFTKATTCQAVNSSGGSTLEKSNLASSDLKSQQSIRRLLTLFEGDGTGGQYVLNDQNFGLNSAGGTLQLNSNHRGLIWYTFVHDLLYSCIKITAEQTNSGGFGGLGSSSGISFNVDSNELDGIIDGLSAAIDNSAGGHEALKVYNHRNKTNIGAGTRYANVKNRAYSKAIAVINAIETRQKKISQQALALVNHASYLSTFSVHANNIIAGRTESGSEKPLTSLGISVLEQNGILADSLTLSTSETAGNAQEQRYENYSLKKNSLFPNFLDVKLGKTKLMYKVLSQAGYGLLPAEKRGNKSIIHVGLPLGMIEALQRFGFEEQQDQSFLNSPYICISIFKEDHLNPGLKFYPKNFIFDTSAKILDVNPDTGDYFSHAVEFDENKNFDQILKSISITRFLQEINEDGTSSGKLIPKITKGYPTGIFSKDVLINHVQDYCFKEYFRLTSSLEFDASFLKFYEQNNSLDLSAFTGDAGRDEYLRVLDKIKRLYPDVNTDAQLAAEVFRLSELLKQVAPFSFAKNFKSAISPNAFDRVYSVVVNEKDFLPEVDDQTMFEMFGQSVSFNHTGKLERPDNLSLAYDPTRAANFPFMGQDGNTVQASKLRRYAESIDENFPGVYQYYAQVSLLPVNFVAGADLSRTTIASNDRSGKLQINDRGDLVKERAVTDFDVKMKI